MNNNHNIPDKDFEDILKKSVLHEPSGDMEDRIMQKIMADAKHSTGFSFGKWIAIMVYGILGSIFAYFLFLPETVRSSLNQNTSINLNRFQVVDPEIFNLGPSQPYLIMSIIVFAVAVWMIILFNLPKKDSVSGPDNPKSGIRLCVILLSFSLYQSFG
jgi:hypothetical protein